MSICPSCARNRTPSCDPDPVGRRGCENFFRRGESFGLEERIEEAQKSMTDSGEEELQSGESNNPRA